MIHKLVKVRGADFCDDQFPIISTIGRGPKGEDAPVPMKFADPIEWDIDSSYDSFTVVMYDGNSYTSKQSVPVGIDISNNEYWVLSGPYNAQVERYHQEVVQTVAELDNWKNETETVFIDAIDNIPEILPSNAFTPEKTVKDYIDDTAPSLRRGVMVVLGDSWSDESNDPSVTWLSQVASALRMHAYITNAKPGTGFAQGGVTIPEQVSGAVNKVIAAGYTADDVTLVIAFGGVNDYRRGQAYTAVATAIRTTYTNARNAFPNAKIQIICGNTGNWSTMDSLDPDTEGRRTSYNDFPSWLANLKNNLRNNGNVANAYCDDVALWLNMYGPSAYNNIWNADTLHPIQTGANIIAHRVVELLEGKPNETFFNVHYSIAKPSNDSSINTLPFDVSYSLNGRHVSIVFNIDTENAVTGLPDTLYWNLGNTVPVICAGNTAYNYRIPVNAWNFGPNSGTPIRGYYNAAINRLTLYPSSTQGNMSQVFGSIEFDLM